LRWNLTRSFLSECRRKWARKDWKVWLGRFRRLRESLKNSSYQVVEEKKAIWDGYHVWLARPLLMWWNASLRVSTKNLKKNYYLKFWTFEILDIPKLGHLKFGTFQTLDFWNFGHFKPWTFECIDFASDFVYHFETSNLVTSSCYMKPGWSLRITYWFLI
jgi:hypothetical protein